MRTVILDTECNGLTDEAICQLSAIIVDDGVYTGINRYFSVDQMGEFALKVHGLSKMRLFELSGGKTFEDCAAEILKLLDVPDIYVGHNISQDIHVIEKNLKRIGMNLGKVRTFCTMKHFNTALHLKSRTGQAKPPRLDELCSHYRIEEDAVFDLCYRVFGEGRYQAHDARYDSAATLLCVLEAQRRGDVRGVIV